MGLRVDSVIDHVTVFPGAARVTRTARVAVSARTELELGGLPLGLDDDSLQVALDGAGRAADLRVTIEVTGRDHATVGDDELHALRRTVAAAQAVRDALRAEVGELSSMAAAAAVPRIEREAPAPAWTDALVARLTVLDARAAREAAVRDELAVAERAEVDAARALAAARDRQARAGTAHREPGSLRKTVVITVEPEGAGGEVTVTLGYLVLGARWAPNYAARLDGAGGVRFELRASVAQATGEDWSQVRLEVSTAAPGRWLDLPELASRRIGRRQARPARPGWRPAPVGVDALFADFDRELRELPARVVPAPEPVRAPPPAAPPPIQPELPAAQAMMTSAPMAAPAPGRGGGVPGLDRARRQAAAGWPAPAAKAKSAAPSKTMTLSMDDGVALRDEQEPEGNLGGLGGGEAELVVGAQLLVYARLRMAGPREPRRGRLVPMSKDQAWGVAADVADEVSARRGPTLPPPPPGLSEASRGVWDHAFTSDGRVDLPADGSWHNLAILSRDARVTLGHVAVPSVALDVYRQATLVNPLDAPLLAGPVDVYDRGELITTTTVDTTAPGAAVELGLGVDGTVKVARNARFHEEVAGMLRGALKLIHEVTIDVENLGPRPIQLEVRERVPIPIAGTEDVEIELDRVQPAWEAWRPEPAPGDSPLRGGHRWRVEVGAQAKLGLRVDYHVRISQKHELVGGNRREP